MKAKPGEFRIHGRKPRKGEEGPQLTVLCAPEVSPQARDYLERQFLRPRLTFAHLANKALAPEPAFSSELLARGYDLTTFRLSLFAEGFGEPRRRLRVMRQVPGLLHARWSWVADDHSPDIVSCWHRPCTKRDSNLFLGLMSMPGLGEDEVSEGRSQYFFSGGFPQAMKQFGMDMRTFNFSVQHAGPLHPEDADVPAA